MKEDNINNVEYLSLLSRISEQNTYSKLNYSKQLQDQSEPTAWLLYYKHHLQYTNCP